MIFHCTLVAVTLGQSTWVPGSTPGGRLIELATDVPDACPGADLEAAIARCYGTGPLFVRGARVAAMTVTTASLVHGAVLVENFVLVGQFRAGWQLPVQLRGPGARSLPRCCWPWTAAPA